MPGGRFARGWGPGSPWPGGSPARRSGLCAGLAGFGGCGCGFGAYHLAFVVSSISFGLSCFALPSLPPRRWLHSRQMMRAFAALSSPPCAHGTMWSTSALLGRLPYSQSRPVLHSGQCVRWASRARTSRTMRFHLAVLVRLAAIPPRLAPPGIARPLGGCCGPGVYLCRGPAAGRLWGPCCACGGGLWWWGVLLW